MEELLNKLIEKGWKPFGKNNRGNVTIDKTIETKSPFFDFDYNNMSVSTRELISKESGLRQFVCENRMVNVNETEVYYFWLKRKGTLDRGHYYLSEACGDIRTNNYEFRLIESALKDESELESFILDNIKL